MLSAKENLEGVEVTVKYVACPKELLEIVMVKSVIISFYMVLVYSFNYCFILHKPGFCLKCHCFISNYMSILYKKKNETDRFPYLSKPCLSLGGFSYRASSSTLTYDLFQILPLRRRRESRNPCIGRPHPKGI